MKRGIPSTALFISASDRFILLVLHNTFIRQGRLQVASEKLLDIIINVLRTQKDVESLGYQLGFSYSTVEKYLNREGASFNSVSRSGFGEMLRDWRRRVRPSEQVDELHVALQNARLGHTADVILPERKYQIPLFPDM